MPAFGGSTFQPQPSPFGQQPGAARPPSTAPQVVQTLSAGIPRQVAPGAPVAPSLLTGSTHPLVANAVIQSLIQTLLGGGRPMLPTGAPGLPTGQAGAGGNPFTRQTDGTVTIPISGQGPGTPAFSPSFSFGGTPPLPQPTPIGTTQPQVQSPPSPFGFAGGTGDGGQR